MMNAKWQGTKCDKVVENDIFLKAFQAKIYEISCNSITETQQTQLKKWSNNLNIPISDMQMGRHCIAWCSGHSPASEFKWKPRTMSYLLRQLFTRTLGPACIAAGDAVCQRCYWKELGSCSKILKLNSQTQKTNIVILFIWNT